jgi:hypothetical protein
MKRLMLPYIETPMCGILNVIKERNHIPGSVILYISTYNDDSNEVLSTSSMIPPDEQQITN